MKSPVYIYLILILLQACSLQEDEAINIHHLDEDEFRIDLMEDLSSGEPELVLHLETIDQFDCKHVEMVLRTEKRGQQIHIIVDDVLVPNVANCVKGNGVAFSDISIHKSTQSTQSTYSVDISLKETFLNQCMLYDHGDEVELMFVKKNGIAAGAVNLKKIPTDIPIAWGYIQPGEQENMDAVNELLSKLRTEFHPISLEPGYYSYFEIDKKGVPTLLNLPSLGIHYELFGRYGNWQQIEAIISEYEGQLSEGTEIHVMNSRGRLL